MFTGPVEQTEVFFYWPQSRFGGFLASGLLLASSPA